MAGWEFGPLLDAVERQHGPAQRALLKPALISVADRRSFARFHYFAAFDAIDKLMGQQGDLGDVLVLLSGDPQFNDARFQAAVNVTAMVHNLHAVADTLGQAIYHALGMNIDRPPSKRSLYAHDVRSLLPPGRLRDLMSELIDHDGHRYLTALSNHSKHYSIVPTPYSIDMTPERATGDGIRFEGFVYQGVPIAPRMAKPTMQAEYDRQGRLFLEIGGEMDKLVDV